MDAAKIQLSPQEAELVLNPDWILTKNNILKKVWQLLETLQAGQQKHLSTVPPEVSAQSGKISKGENYKGLPYLILDQPRYFDKDNIFAIRTLFWWGHFFSSTLHLAGDYKKMYEKKIIAALPLLKDKDFFICINADPWEHHFETGNFVPAGELSTASFEDIAGRRPFIKLSKKISLKDWNTAGERLLEIFGEYIEVIGR